MFLDFHSLGENGWPLGCWTLQGLLLTFIFSKKRRKKKEKITGKEGEKVKHPRANLKRNSLTQEQRNATLSGDEKKWGNRSLSDC